MSAQDKATLTPSSRTVSLIQLLTLVVALCSVIVASISSVVSYRVMFGRQRLIAIDSIYDEFSEWSRAIVAIPGVSHLLASPEQYDRHCALVEASIVKLPDERLYELLLIEQTFAVAIFNYYERTVVDLAQARESGDRFRTNLLESIVAEQEQEMLRNPRLRSLLDEPREHLSAIVRNRYTQHVIDAAGRSPATDPIGPIGRELARRGLHTDE